MIREIQAQEITKTIAALCQQSNVTLGDDIVGSLQRAEQNEDWPPARHTLRQLLKNLDIAETERLPICQDTGMACVFLEIGQNLHIQGDLRQAVDEGVRQGYAEGYLRKSIVRDPLRRENTGDNTPAMLHCDILPGDALRITVAPKGFGSENMSKIAMLRPSDGEEGVKNFVLEVVRAAGPNPCPPLVVGVGIGSNFDGVALLAKKALLRPIDTAHPDPHYAQMEADWLLAINQLGIGPQGFGGRCTALGLNIQSAPTHIAGLPVAVNLCCHVARHASAVL